MENKYPRGSYIVKLCVRCKVLGELGDLRFVSVPEGTDEHWETTLTDDPASAWHVAELEREGWKVEEDAKAPEPWKPEDGDHLWFLDETCTPVISCHEMPYSDLPVLIKNGNCYRSREEAEKAAELVRKAYRG
jgi:hypothetical protein